VNTHTQGYTKDFCGDWYCSLVVVSYDRCLASYHMFEIQGGCDANSVGGTGCYEINRDRRFSNSVTVTL